MQKRSEVEIDIILSPKQAQSFRDRINQDGTDAHAIDEALAHVLSENAEASVQADLAAIRTLIQKYSGGFDTLDDTVRQYLRKWFVSHGGIKVVARRRQGGAGDGGNSAAAITSSSSVERVRPETSFTGFDPGSDSGAADETNFTGFDIPASRKDSIDVDLDLSTFDEATPGGMAFGFGTGKAGTATAGPGPIKPGDRVSINSHDGSVNGAAEGNEEGVWGDDEFLQFL